MAVVGIDLGTTNSLIAVWEDKGARLIPNGLGEHLTPSAVSIDGDEVLVGRAAIERLITHPDCTVASFKRFMGTNRQVKLSGRAFRPEELSALVLGSLKRAAEEHLGEKITDAIISVPAYFNDLQRKSTLAAARIAGLPVERLINEPTAAALAYGLEQESDVQFLVFDLGGGTFDVSILDKYDDVMEVRASAGDNSLGGNDFRDTIAEMILATHTLPADRLTPVERQQLVRTAEEVKRSLTSQQKTDYALVLKGRPRAGAVSREAFEQTVASLVRRLRGPLEQTIADSRIRPEDIAQIVMVGGATRMPMIRGLVARLFGRLPLTHIDPDRVVAMGAAVQAGLKSRHKALNDVVMTDVCPYTLGIGALNGGDRPVVVPIIERNTVVPVSRSKPFFTVFDDQQQLSVQVYQGEQLLPENNVHLGGLEMAVPKGKASSVGVNVRFTYDVNGILELEVNVLGSDHKERKVFQNASSLTEVEIEAALARLSHLKVPPVEQEENRALLARGERIYAELLGSDRERVSEVVQRFRIDISNASPNDAGRVRSAFKSLLDSLDSRKLDSVE